MLHRKIDGLSFTFLFERDIHDRYLFSYLITEPARPTDFYFTNGRVKVAVHRYVVRKISPVFANILEGDTTTNEFLLKDMTDSALKDFQQLIYMKSRSFYGCYGYAENSKDNLFSASMDLVCLVDLATKWDCKIAKYYLNSRFERTHVTLMILHFILFNRTCPS